MAVNNIRRNPFWQIIQQELPKFGFTLYDVEPQGTDYKVVIQGQDPNGRHTTQEYVFARVCRHFRSQANFRSDFRRFLKFDLPNRQFLPRDHHTRQPGMFVQKIQHEPVKKPLVAPKPLQVAAAEMRLPDILVWPTLPESYTTDRIVQKPKDVGPLSTTMSIAAFLVANADLAPLLELMNGLAVLRGVKPAPIKLTGESAPYEGSGISISKVAQTFFGHKPAEPVAPPPAENVVPITRRRVNQGAELTMEEQMINTIISNPSKVFTSEDFITLSRNRNSLSATLSRICMLGKISRVRRGEYTANLQRQQKA